MPETMPEPEPNTSPDSPLNPLNTSPSAPLHESLETPQEQALAKAAPHPHNAASSQPQPLIDVMLPYYGDVDYFKTAVTSVLEQTDTNWRLAIFDDGYPSEEPRRWVESLGDNRVRYERNAENLGANGNYRKALAAVTAPYFIMMGADDIMQPHHVEHLSTLIRAVPSADVIQTGVAVVDEHGDEYLPMPDRAKRWYAPHGTSLRLLEGEDMATSLLRADWLYFPSLVWCTSVVRRHGFRRGLDVVQDLALLLDIAADNGTLAYDPVVSFSYRRHAGSDSSKRAFDGRRFDEERAFFAREAERFATLGWRRAAAAAKTHSSSRLNAAAQLPKALQARSWSALAALSKHIVS